MDITYIIINRETWDIIDGSFDDIETANKFLKLIIENDRLEYPPDLWSDFCIIKETREIME